MKKYTLLLPVVAALAFGGGAWAQEHGEGHGSAPAGGSDMAGDRQGELPTEPTNDTNSAHVRPHGAPVHTTHDPAAQAGAAEAEGEHGHAEEHHGPPKPINWMDFENKEQPPFGAMILNFVILMGIYWYFGRKPISEALKTRRANVAKEIEEAQRIRAEAEERALVYQKKLERLEDELRDTRAALVEAGKGERDRIIREAEEKSARMEKDAAFLVDQEVKQLRQDLTREAVEIAVAAAEELLRKRVTPVDQERLAEDYLAELAAKTKSTSIPVPSRPPPSAPPAPSTPPGARS